MIYPIRRIVAGIEELSTNDFVLAEALELGKRLGAEVHLVHAYELSPILWDAYATLGYAAATEVEAHSANVRSKLAELAVQQPDVHVTAHAVIASPASAIRDVAEEVDADLVLVGATRHGRLGRLLLGTTAQRVLRGATRPTLVMRQKLAARPRRVLLTADLSELSQGVHELGLDVLESLVGRDTLGEADLRSMIVVAPAPLPPPLGADGLRQIGQARLEKELSERRKRDFSITPVARIGDPADEIAREAEEWSADYVVLGSHSRKGIDRSLLGSVAESAIRGITTANVLVIPAEASARRHLPILQAAGQAN